MKTSFSSALSAKSDLGTNNSRDFRNESLRAAPQPVWSRVASERPVATGGQPRPCSRTNGLLTLEEAVAAAACRFREELRIGADVWTAVRSQHPYAGPPEKVFAAMVELAHWARIRRVLDVGDDPVGWLTEQGLECAVDPAPVRSDFCARRQRTFAIGERRAYLPFFVALAEGLEIRFLWGGEEEVIVIGFVGERRISVLEEK